MRFRPSITLGREGATAESGEGRVVESPRFYDRRGGARERQASGRSRKRSGSGSGRRRTKGREGRRKEERGGAEKDKEKPVENSTRIFIYFINNKDEEEE